MDPNPSSPIGCRATATAQGSPRPVAGIRTGPELETSGALIPSAARPTPPCAAARFAPRRIVTRRTLPSRRGWVSRAALRFLHLPSESAVLRRRLLPGERVPKDRWRPPSTSRFRAGFSRRSIARRPRRKCRSRFGSAATAPRSVPSATAGPIATDPRPGAGLRHGAAPPRRCHPAATPTAPTIEEPEGPVRHRPRGLPWDDAPCAGCAPGGATPRRALPRRLPWSVGGTLQPLLPDCLDTPSPRRRGNAFRRCFPEGQELGTGTALARMDKPEQMAPTPAPLRGKISGSESVAFNDRTARSAAWSRRSCLVWASSCRSCWSNRTASHSTVAAGTHMTATKTAMILRRETIASIVGPEIGARVRILSGIGEALPTGTSSTPSPSQTN